MDKKSRVISDASGIECGRRFSGSIIQEFDLLRNASKLKVNDLW